MSERTIDDLTRWIERCVFHSDGFNPPTKSDLHVWLKHTKKFKREQNNLETALKDAKKRIAELTIAKATHFRICERLRDELATSEKQVTGLREALQGAEKNTTLLIEHAYSIYEKHGFAITKIGQALKETADKETVTDE